VKCRESFSAAAILTRVSNCWEKKKKEARQVARSGWSFFGTVWKTTAKVSEMWKIYEGSIQKRKGRTREIGDQDIIGECQVTGKTESKTQLANGLKCKRRESGRRFRRSRRGFFGPFKCFPSFQTKKKTRIVHNCVIDGTMDISVCYLFLDFGKKQAKKQREIKCPKVESSGYYEAVRIRWEYKLKFPGPSLPYPWIIPKPHSACIIDDWCRIVYKTAKQNYIAGFVAHPFLRFKAQSCWMQLCAICKRPRVPADGSMSLSTVAAKASPFELLQAHAFYFISCPTA